MVVRSTVAVYFIGKAFKRGLEFAMVVSAVDMVASAVDLDWEAFWGTTLTVAAYVAVFYGVHRMRQQKGAQRKQQLNKQDGK